MKRSFTVIIERDPESDWLVGEAVELPGCYTQAPDLPTLERNAREAIQAYLKTAEPVCGSWNRPRTATST